MRLFEIDNLTRRRKLRVDKLFTMYSCNQFNWEVIEALLELINIMYPTNHKGIDDTLVEYKNKILNDFNDTVKNK